MTFSREWLIKCNRQYCIKVKLENQHTLDQEYGGFYEAIQQILPPRDKPRNYLGGLSFLFEQTDQDADSDLYGGYSASDHTDAGQTIGHTTSGNTLSVTRIASRKNINAYGGYTGGTLDTYAKYFYTHQSGGSERLTTGETYEFDDVDSSRLRIGTRWTKKTLAGEFYTGLAYEYEFGSDARASYAGYGTPTPTLKGSTGLFELGYRFVRPDSNVSYGVNLTGMMGKRRGITGSMQVNWAL